MRRILVPFLIFAALCGHVWAQSEDTAPVERTYPFSVDAVQKALQRIGGFGGGKLPVLDGFVNATDPERYDHPYFQYRVHLKSVDPNTTLVSVEAKISALFVNQDPAHPEYQALPSNGRLESDLHDRLQQALRATSAAPPMQPRKDAAPPITQPAEVATTKSSSAAHNRTVSIGCDSRRTTIRPGKDCCAPDPNRPTEVFRPQARKCRQGWVSEAFWSWRDVPREFRRSSPVPRTGRR